MYLYVSEITAQTDIPPCVINRKTTKTNKLFPIVIFWSKTLVFGIKHMPPKVYICPKEVLIHLYGTICHHVFGL